MGSWAEGARGHGRSTGAAFLYRPDIGKHEEDWWWRLWKRAGAGGLHTRSSRFAFFFKRGGESAVEPRCRFSASAANNFSGKRWFRAASCNFNSATCVPLNKLFLVLAFAESNFNFLLLVNPGGLEFRNAQAPFRTKQFHKKPFKHCRILFKKIVCAEI